MCLVREPNIPWSLEIEDIVHTIARDGHVGSGRLLRPIAFRLKLEGLGKVRGKCSNISCCLRSGNCTERGACRFESLIHNFKQFSLLRVHTSRLKRMHAEERRDKIPVAVIVGEEVAFSGNNASSSFGIRLIPLADVESVGWNVGLGRATRDDELPELGW